MTHLNILSEAESPLKDSALLPGSKSQANEEMQAALPEFHPS